MTSEKNACKRIVIFFLLAFSSLSLFAKMPGQTERSVFISNNCGGFLEYLPTTYNSTTTRYPLLINILGLGTQGDGSITSLQSLYDRGGGNPHEQAENDMWQESYTVNGQTFSFIVLTPQGKTDVPQPADINALIDYAIANYRIDTSRIYLIGSSEGGGSVWNYAGSNPVYAKRLAAIIPFSGVAFPIEDSANIIRHSRVAVWGFHNSNDGTVPSYFTSDFVDFINYPTPAPVEARKTLFPASGHISWYDPLMRIWKDGSMTVYEWLLKFRRSFSKANAGYYQEISAPATSIQLHGGGTGPNGNISNINWQKVSGPAGGTISDASILNPTINSLSPGIYVYRLAITDNTAATGYDTVEVRVNPARTRIYADTYSAASGVNKATSASEGRQIVKNIDGSDWMDFNINVAAAGNYKIRFRFGSFYDQQQFVLKRGSTVLATKPVWWTRDWDAFRTMTVLNVPLIAGDQTLTIQNINPPSAGAEWYINWFEIESLTAVQGSLPVSFTLFNANCSGSSVNLTWSTASESNSQQFSIEKSSDGRSWNTISTVAAAGQSSTEKKYSYVDNTASGNDFYRIVQQDNDGRKTFTSVLRSNCGSKQAFAVFPNPANDKTTITINSNQNAKMNVSIIDNKGAVVRKQQTVLLQGSNQVTINLTGLAKGVYSLQAEWNGERKTTKLIKN